MVLRRTGASQPPTLPGCQWPGLQRCNRVLSHGGKGQLCGGGGGVCPFSLEGRALTLGGGGLAQGLGIRLFAFGGAYWPLATVHSDPPWARTCFGCGGVGGGGGAQSVRAHGGWYNTS